MNGLKARIRQLLVVCGLAVSMALTSVPINAVPVYAEENSEEGNDTTDNDTTGNNNSGSAEGSTQQGNTGSAEGSTQQGNTGGTEGGTQKGNAGSTEGGTQTGTDQGAITSGKYIGAPTNVKWVDESKLIMGFSKVENADWYEVSYEASGMSDYSSFFPANDSGNYLKDVELFTVNVKNDLQSYEATNNKEISGQVNIKIYAIKGSNETNRADRDKATYVAFTVDNYESYLKNLKETQAPTDVQLKFDNNNKLVISFKQEKVSKSDTESTDTGSLIYPDEYQVEFYLNNEETVHSFCYDRYTYPGNLVWSEKEGRIEIPVSDYLRSEYLDKAQKDVSKKILTVTVKAHARVNDENRNFKYKVSQASASIKALDYKNATITKTTVNDEAFKEGTLQEINGDDVKKICKDAPANSTLQLKVQATSAEENIKKAKEFQTNKTKSSYTDFSTFEINLKLVTKGDNGTTETKEVTETTTTMLITIPIPESLQGKNIVILRKHGEAIEEIGSTVDNTNNTVSFYTDKFSDYAIAVKTDSSSDTPAEPETPTKPDTPSSGGGSAAPSVNKTTATKTVSDAVTSAKAAVTDSTLSTAAKDLASSLIEKAKADADKAISSAASTSAANTAATDAETAIKEITERVEKAEKITDVSGSGDQKDAVQYGIIKGYINGTSDTTFAPTGNVTRAQFVTFLYRLAGSPAVTGSADFVDVKGNLGGSDFAAAIKWASDNKIAQGLGNGVFNPGGVVTREQAVAFLHRYFTSISGGDSNAFADVKDGAWYEQDINWGVGSGIVNGISDKAFGVGDSTTRAQAAQFIYRAATK